MSRSPQLARGLFQRMSISELPADERQPFSVLGLPHDHTVWPLVDPHAQLIAAGRRHDHRAEHLRVHAAPLASTS